jgi:hypothetical protein
MYACNTEKLPAICREHLEHYEHVDTQDISMISKLIGFFKTTCRGNGRLTLIVNGGKVQDFEPTSRIHNEKTA